MTEQKRIIWSNDLNYEDWREDLEAEYPDMTESERIALMYETTAITLMTSAVILTCSYHSPSL